MPFATTASPISSLKSTTHRCASEGRPPKPKMPFPTFRMGNDASRGIKQEDEDPVDLRSVSPVDDPVERKPASDADGGEGARHQGVNDTSGSVADGEPGSNDDASASESVYGDGFQHSDSGSGEDGDTEDEDSIGSDEKDITLSLRDQKYKEKIIAAWDLLWAKEYSSELGVTLERKKEVCQHILDKLKTETSASGGKLLRLSTNRHYPATDKNAFEKILNDVSRGKTDYKHSLYVEQRKSETSKVHAQDDCDAQNSSNSSSDEGIPVSSTRKKRKHRRNSDEHFNTRDHMAHRVRDMLKNHGWKLKRLKRDVGDDIWAVYREGSDEDNAIEGEDKLTGVEAMLDWAYLDGFYEEQVVQTEVGKGYLEHAGILDDPYCIFSEELIRRKKRQKVEQEEILGAQSESAADATPNDNPNTETNGNDDGSESNCSTPTPRDRTNAGRDSETSVHEAPPNPTTDQDSASRELRDEEGGETNTGNNVPNRHTASDPGAEQIEMQAIDMYKKIKEKMSCAMKQNRTSRNEEDSGDGKEEQIVLLKKEFYCHLKQWLTKRAKTVSLSDITLVQNQMECFESSIAKLDRLGDKDDITIYTAGCECILRECKESLPLANGEKSVVDRHASMMIKQVLQLYELIKDKIAEEPKTGGMVPCGSLQKEFYSPLKKWVVLKVKTIQEAGLAMIRKKMNDFDSALTELENAEDKDETFFFRSMCERLIDGCKRDFP